MKKYIILIIILCIGFKGFSASPSSLVEDAVAQIDYLYARNQKIEDGKLSAKKWYLYVLGSDKPTLESYLIGEKEIQLKTFSTDYLEHLNSLLVQFNTSTEAAMYVAVSDYDTPIVIPILPDGKSLGEKIQSLNNMMDPENPSYINIISKDIDYNELKKGLKGYENYKTFFYRKSQEIFEQSVLSKVSGEKRVLMPFSTYHYVHFHHKETLFHTFTIHSSKKDEAADEAVKDWKEIITGLRGKTKDEKKIEGYVRAYLEHYLGNTAVTLTPNTIKTQIPKDSQMYVRSYDKNNDATADKVFDLSKQLLDFAGVLNQEDKQQIFQQAHLSRTLLEDMKMYVVLTDQDTPAEILENIKTLEPPNNQYYIWIHIDREGEVSLSNIVSKESAKGIAYATAHWTERMWANIALNLGEGTVSILKENLAFNNMVLTYVSDIIKKGEIPEKYWNPNHVEYPEYMAYLAQAFAVLMGDFGSAISTQEAQMQFALKCGVWNGVVEELGALPELGKMVNEYFLYPEKSKEFDNNLSNLTINTIWNGFKAAHGYEEDKPTDEFELAHQLGKDVVFIATLFIGIGEVSALLKSGKLATNTGKLVGNINKISNAISHGAIRMLKKLPKNITDALYKLPDNIIKETQQIAGKTYLILKSNNSIKLAKISEDAVFSELKLMQEGAVVKLTDGGDAVFEVRYIDEFGEHTGTLTLVKQGDEIGIRIGDDIINKIDIRSNDLGHIFSTKPNKLAKTDGNIRLIKEIAANENNLKLIDQYGKKWYTKIQEDGSEIYIYVKDGYIKGAGVNKKPRFNYDCK